MLAQFYYSKWLSIYLKSLIYLKFFLKNILEKALEAKNIAWLGSWVFRKVKSAEILANTGDFSVFYCPIFSFILRYCRIFSKDLKTVCRQARGFAFEPKADGSLLARGEAKNLRRKANTPLPFYIIWGGTPKISSKLVWISSLHEQGLHFLIQQKDGSCEPSF